MEIIEIQDREDLMRIIADRLRQSFTHIRDDEATAAAGGVPRTLKATV